MINNRRFFSIVFVLLVSFTLCFSCTSTLQGFDRLNAIAQQIQQSIQTELDSLDSDMSVAASQLVKTGLSGNDARQILNSICTKYTFVIDCAAANTDGKLVTVAPDVYRSYEGSDISKQEVTIEFNKTKKPRLSKVFRAVEGFDAVVLIWPINSDKGEYMGSMSALFKPETLYAAASKNALQGINAEVMGLQTDGYVIYSIDANEQGKNLLVDPEYKQYTELLQLGARFVAEVNGTGTYLFPSSQSGKQMVKQASWVSLKIRDTEWRVIAVGEGK